MPSSRHTLTSILLSGFLFMPTVKGVNTDLSSSVLISLINLKRTEQNFVPLIPNDLLSQAAQNKAEDMLANDYWSHVSPALVSPWSFIEAVGYGYQAAGENLAKNFDNAEALVNAWDHSPSHRQNMLNPIYREIGIGIAPPIVVALFASREYHTNGPPTYTTTELLEDSWLAFNFILSLTVLLILLLALFLFLRSKHHFRSTKSKFPPLSWWTNP